MNNNILFFLKPKAMCAFLHDDDSLRQALEKMEKLAIILWFRMFRPSHKENSNG